MPAEFVAREEWVELVIALALIPETFTACWKTSVHPFESLRTNRRAEP